MFSEKLAFHKKKSRKSRFCAILEPQHPPFVWENGQNDQIPDQNGNIAGNRWGVVGWSDIIQYAPPLGLRVGPIRSGKLPALPEIRPILRFFGPIFWWNVYIYFWNAICHCEFNSIQNCKGRHLQLATVDSIQSRIARDATCNCDFRHPGLQGMPSTIQAFRLCHSGIQTAQVGHGEGPKRPRRVQQKPILSRPILKPWCMYVSPR